MPFIPGIIATPPKSIRFILLALCLLTYTNQYSQSPGGVGTGNLTAWWKPDNLANGDATSWTTTYPTGADEITVSDNSFPYPLVTDDPDGDISNYNKTLDFNGNTQASQKALQNFNSQNLLDNSSSGDEGSFFCSYYFPTASTNDHILLYNESGNDAIQLRELGTDQVRLAIGRGLGINLNACRVWTEAFVPNILSYYGNRNNSSSLNAFDRSWESDDAVSSQSSGPIGIHFGLGPETNTSQYNGFIHEYIFFNDNLTELEMSKVHTYLAIKYGVTLLNTGGGDQGDYVATDGTLIWDADFYSNYHNDVIGIGRDDIEDLIQKQSHSFDDTTRVYIGTLEVTNSDNLSTISNDISYITLGHNQGLMCGTSDSNLETPAGFIGSRIEREWKVSNSNFDDPFSIDFKIDPCEIPNIPDLASGRLLIGEDDDLTNASAYGPADGLSFTYNDGVLSVSGISNSLIPVNSTRFITVATQDATIEMSSDLEICDGESTYLQFTLLSGDAPDTLIYSDGTNLFSIPNFDLVDSVLVSPSQTTTYEIISNNMHFNCCESSSSENNHTIQVNPNPVVIANADNAILCLGDSTTLYGSGAESYSWSNDAIDGEFISPSLGTTTYEVIGVNTFGCPDTSTIDIVVQELPIIDAGEDQFHCFDLDLQITLQGSGGVDYEWNQSVVDGELFSPPLGLTTYTVIGTGANGCTAEDQVSVEIAELPNVDAGPDIYLCTNGTDQVTLTGSGAITYSWDNGITDGVGFIPPLGQTLYSVTGTDGFGCQNTDVVEVESYEIPVVLFEASSLSGCAPTEITFTDLSDSNSINCTWIVENDIIDECDSYTHTFYSPGVYDVSLSLTTPEGCTGSLGMTNYIEIFQNPNASFGTSADFVTNYDTEVSFNNNSFLGENYTWSFGDGIESNEENPIHSFPNEEGFYEVQLVVESANGCLDSITSTIEVKGIFNVYIPNTFSPNNDLHNDIFIPVFSSSHDQEAYEFLIFNRWGELIFETNDPTIGWNGSAFGGEYYVSDGIYIWKITYQEETAPFPIEKMGSVNVIR